MITIKRKEAEFMTQVNGKQIENLYERRKCTTETRSWYRNNSTLKKIET